MAIQIKNRTQKSKTLILALAAAVAAGWGVSSALAQTPPDSAPPDKIAPPLEENARPSVDGGVDKIKPQDGVIKPPANVDPDIQVKPPATGGTMPIIPPPGSPGGDPNIKPK